MDSRREFLKQISILSAAAGFSKVLHPAIQKALAINPEPGSSYLDAEHIVFLMQENRSFDHAFGTLQGVRGFNDPRAITLPNKNPVWLQSNKKGETYAPFRLDIKDTKATWMGFLPHAWANQVDARNNGKHDKWLDAKHSKHKEYENLPLTLGYYTREDIPFYYALADAFTICDQHFCSSLTGTTANRLYFWTGTIREEQNENARANLWNEDVDHDNEANWTTYPERLDENGISWKVYQNELYIGAGLTEEEDAWLGNFGDNPLEYFSQFKVRFSEPYISHLSSGAEKLGDEIERLQSQLQALSDTDKESEKIKKKIEKLQKELSANVDAQTRYTREAYNQLTEKEKSLHQKAFTTNNKDPFYHELDSLHYQDEGIDREVKIPKGDVLYQFREDVKNGTLPTVSWIAAPENFSDHPTSAWYGSWYISEVMDILTQNPEVWKKTIFILTYDENDGYFDHVPPFVTPHPYKTGTGLTSEGINTGVEYVSDEKQQSSKPADVREGPIGLGYRVPMIVISPWSRGGWVCSEVFDHTSSLQFLEKFLANKFGKNITETNITPWRRTVCGDLSAAFRKYNGEKITAPSPVVKDAFIESIHKAQFKNVPSNYKILSADEIQQLNKDPQASPYMPAQENGIRSSCALPYELYVDGRLSKDKKSFEIKFKAGSTIFGKRSSGSPFNVYAPGNYLNEAVHTWAYAVKAGDSLKDTWPLNNFENNNYHLRVYGPNGFFREFIGGADDDCAEVVCHYEHDKADPTRLSGGIVFTIKNNGHHTCNVEIIDNAYKATPQAFTVHPENTGADKKTVVFNLDKNYNWYDFSIKIKGNDLFEKRYAGRVETGNPSKTDPVMGKII